MADWTGVRAESERMLRPDPRRQGALRWSAAKEEQFLAHLADSANVTRAARAIGFSRTLVYLRRKSDPHFRARWDEAFAAGYERLETALLRNAIALLEGEAEDGTPPMAVREAIALLSRHREKVSTGLTRAGWRKRAPDPKAARAQILKRTEAYRRARMQRELALGRCLACDAPLSEAARAARIAGTAL